MNALPELMVAPNGGRLQKSDHPAIPITLEEILVCAENCYHAGADGLHLHLRDERGAHLLDAGAYSEALQECNARLPELPVQITTEAVGRYDVSTQIQVALTSGAKMVSVATREITRDGDHAAERFFVECSDAGIAVQHILYELEDADMLARLLPDTLLRTSHLQLLFVLGQYGTETPTPPNALDQFVEWLDRMSLRPDWAVCAFGRRETSLLLSAAGTGGKCRVGFENSRFSADGSIARDNAQRVAEIVYLLRPSEGQDSRAHQC